MTLDLGQLENLLGISSYERPGGSTQFTPRPESILRKSDAQREAKMGTRWGLIFGCEDKQVSEAGSPNL